MSSDNNVFFLPVPTAPATCHLPVPRFDEVIEDHGSVSQGLAHLAVELEMLAEKFQELSEIFGECPEATYSTSSHFICGKLTFVFSVPRSYLPHLVEFGWDESDLDVRPDGTIGFTVEDPDA